MLLKIILSKTFEKLSWSYIRQLLTAFGFFQTWVRWLMNLISSPIYSILVNGIPSKPYSPSRGIHQGDPLSPFLFIIMEKGLGRLINNVVQSHELKGILAHGTPTITHQQLVDDNMLFGHPSVSEARAFKALIETFSMALRPLILLNLKFFSSILLLSLKEKLPES